MAAHDPASPRQLAYIKELAYSRGVSFIPPANRVQASRLIDQLQQRERSVLFEIAADRVDSSQHLDQVAADRHFLHRERELAVLDPDSVRAARVVAGDHVGAASEHGGDVEAVAHFADDFLRTPGARLEIEVAGPNRRQARPGARGAPRALRLLSAP